jgi:hypothetical protein
VGNLLSDVPTVTESDRRLARLQENRLEDTWSDEDEEESEDNIPPAPRRSQKPAAALRSYLEPQSKSQLITLLEELAESYPIVHESLLVRRNLAAGTVQDLLKQARQEIDRLSAEPGWRNHWDDEGYTPDYSRVWDRLPVLLEGHIAQTQTRTYEQACGYLCHLRDRLKKLGREQEWQDYLTDLRQVHTRKRRLLELLDDLEGRRIIDR